MTHDPLCPLVTDDPDIRSDYYCGCQLIAKVRDNMISQCVGALITSPGIYLNLWNPEPPLRKWIDELDAIASLIALNRVDAPHEKLNDLINLDPS